MGKSDIEIAVLRHRRARIMELRHRQVLNADTALPPETINHMAQTTYNVATEGNIDGFAVLVRENRVPLLTQVTPQRNTILHLAVIYGHIELLERIVIHDHERLVVGDWNQLPSGYQSLLLKPNSSPYLSRALFLVLDSFFSQSSMLTKLCYRNCTSMDE